MIELVTLGSILAGEFLYTALYDTLSWNIGEGILGEGPKLWRKIQGKEKALEKALFNTTQDVINNNYPEHKDKLPSFKTLLKKKPKITIQDKSKAHQIREHEFCELLKEAGIPHTHVNKIHELVKKRFVHYFIKNVTGDDIAEAVTILFEESQDIKDQLCRNRKGITHLIKMLKAHCEGDKELEKKVDFASNIINKKLDELLIIGKRTELKIDNVGEDIKALKDGQAVIIDMMSKLQSKDDITSLTKGDIKYLDDVDKIAKKSKDEWSSLLIQGEIALLRGNYNLARDLLDRTMLIAETNNDEKQMAETYFVRANLYFELGEVDAGIKLLNQSIDLLRKLNQVANLARAFNNLALTYQQQGELDKALDTFSITNRMMNEGDYYGLAITLRNIGTIYKERGDYVIALEKYKESLSLLDKELSLPYQDSDIFLRKRSHIKQLYANTLSDIAYLDKIKGDYKSAQKHYNESLNLLIEIEDKIGVARIQGLMAEIPWAEGKYQEALRMLKDSLEIMEQAGNKREIAHAKEDLGRLYLAMEEFNKAKELLEGSVTLFSEMGDRLHIRSAKHNLANVFEHLGDYNAAAKIHEEILNFSIRIGDKLGCALSMHQLGLFNLRNKHYDSALNMFEEALKVSEEIGYKDNIARALYQIGVINIDKGDYNKASELFNRCIKMTRELNDVELIWIIHGGIANLYVKKGEYEKAIQEYSISLEMVTKLGKKDSICHLFIWIGDTYQKLGKLDKANSMYEQAINTALNIADNKYRAIVLVGIGAGFSEKGDHEKAIQLYEKALEVNEGDIWAWNNKGASLAALNKYEDAIRAYDRALILNSTLIEAIMGKAKTLHKLGNFNEAIIYFGKASELNPMATDILNEKGICFGEMEQQDNALQCFRKALDIYNEYLKKNPQDMNALLSKGQCLSNMGISYYRKKEYDTALGCFILASNLLEHNNSLQRIPNYYMEKIRNEMGNKLVK